jgi:hypothetical protein
MVIGGDDVVLDRVVVVMAVLKEMENRLRVSRNQAIQKTGKQKEDRLHCRI